jgi:hypothetical protein
VKFLGVVIVLALIGGAAYFLPDLLAEFPTEGMAEEAVENKLAGQSSDVAITLFKKMDGQPRTEEDGVQYYKLDCDGVVEFKKDTMWIFIGGFQTTDPLPPKASKKERKAAEARLAGKASAKKGETVMVKGTVEFEKKESGWVVHRTSLRLKP